MAWSSVSPAWVSDLRAALDAEGNIVALHSAQYSPHMFDLRPLRDLPTEMPKRDQFVSPVSSTDYDGTEPPSERSRPAADETAPPLKRARAPCHHYNLAEERASDKALAFWPTPELLTIPSSLQSSQSTSSHFFSCSLQRPIVSILCGLFVQKGSGRRGVEPHELVNIRYNFAGPCPVTMTKVE